MSKIVQYDNLLVNFAYFGAFIENIWKKKEEECSFLCSRDCMQFWEDAYWENENILFFVELRTRQHNSVGECQMLVINMGTEAKNKKTEA